MPRNTQILMIRHGEKPDSGTGLSGPGQERAQAYAIRFRNYSLGSGPIKLDYLFATADSSESHRTRLTIKPLAKALGLDINDKYKDDDYSKAAKDILKKSKYNNSNILICWHHEEILKLAAALGVDASKLPRAATWPAPPWPNDVFGWLLAIRYGDDGKVDVSQTKCVNQRLMYDDYGKNPPAAKSAAKPAAKSAAR